MTTTSLSSLTIGDAPESWERAGFLVERSAARTQVRLGPVAVVLSPGEHRGVIAVDTRAAKTENGEEGGDDSGDAAQSASETSHPNGVTRIDHVVISSTQPAVTQSELEALGCRYRRTRTVGEGADAMEQRFLWWGATLIELIGPAQPSDDEPATSSVWGLSLAVRDLDASAQYLGDLLGPIKEAVQSGRSIATLRTGALDISTRIALMSPHVKADGPAITDSLGAS